MPVKWTPDKDQLLLLKILETHDISVDAKKISAAWREFRAPCIDMSSTDRLLAADDKGEAPTARAITERLVKIRQLARANGAGNFPISSSQSKGGGSKPSTPRKPTVPSTSTPRARVTQNISPSKRTHDGQLKEVKRESIESDDDDLVVMLPVSARPGTPPSTVTDHSELVATLAEDEIDDYEV